MYCGLHHLRFFSVTTNTEITADNAAFRLCYNADELSTLPEHILRFRDIHIRRFAEGHIALIGEDDEKTSFIAWLAFAQLRIDELGKNWILPHDEVVVYDVYTVPEHRGKGLYTAALRWIVQTLSEKGIIRCWIYAEHSNSASLRGIQKARFRYAGSVKALRIGRYALRRGHVHGSGL